MPAPASLSIAAVADQVGAVELPDPVALAPRLADALIEVADPRKRRGVRHGLVVVLTAAVCAVAAGARSFVAVAEWVADLPVDVAVVLGVNHRCPSESTIRRILGRVDADRFDAVIGGFVQRLCVGADLVGRRRVLAVDGKTVRGSRGPHGPARHLFAVIDQQTRAVLGQVDVEGKTNEITAFAPLLDTLTGIDLTGVVITADALHTQREHVADLRVRGAHWVLTVKGSQPRLRRQLAGLPWRGVEADHRSAQPRTGVGRSARSRLSPSRPGSSSHTPPRPYRSPARPARPAPGRAGAAGGAPRPSTRSPTWARTRPARTNSPPGCAVTGRSRTPCTGSAT